MTTQTGKTLHEMAEVADAVYSLLPTRPTIHETSRDASLHTRIEQLTQELSALKIQMAAMVNQVQEVYGVNGARPRNPRARVRVRDPDPDPESGAQAGYVGTTGRSMKGPTNVPHLVHGRRKTSWAVVNGGWPHLPHDVTPSVCER